MTLPTQPASRTYAECPRCRSPRAFVTYERARSQCSFCPDCRYIWDTISATPEQERLVAAPQRSRVTS